MKRLLLFIIMLGMLSCGCGTVPKDTAFQASTIDALLAGVYDGDMSCHELLTHGNFGIGTFDHLDGEMVVLDSRVYQIKADGAVYKPDLSTKTPFATVCQFDTDKCFSITPGMDYKNIEQIIDKEFPNQNLFYAIKIVGQFSSVKTRSVPGQHKPYPPLNVVTKDQPEFNMNNVAGTIVGFRCPAYVKGINVPGYHLHFLSNDQTQGGHILNFEIEVGSGEIDVLDLYALALPTDNIEFGETDLSKDRTSELEDAEK